MALTADDRLISAGRDNRLRVWKLNEPEVQLVADHAGRTGEVQAFNAHPQGKFVLFDHGDELRILDAHQGTVAGELKLRKQGHFQNFAHFSPRGTFLLTNLSIGRIQVWKGLSETGVGPEKMQDGQELCHYPVANNSVACGVFAPDESVFFSAGADHVIRVWPLPTERQWKQPLIGTLTYVGNQLERGTDTVRIRVDVENPTEPERRLRTGMLANLRFSPSPATR